MTNKSESAQDGTPAPSRESQHRAALLCPLAWLLRGREGIRVEALLAKVALLVDLGFVPLLGDAEGQTAAAPRSEVDSQLRPAADDPEPLAGPQFGQGVVKQQLSLIHISEPTRPY